MNWIDIECAQIPVWENTIPYLYLDSDTPPNATTAQGLLVPTLTASVLLPWKNSRGIVATNAAIAADWNRVKAMPGGHDAEFYQSPTGLMLLPDDIATLTRNFVTGLYPQILSLFPSFDTYPESAQVGIADMAYNPGVGRLRATYPQFCAAVKDQDWKTAAAQCGRNTWMKAFAARDAWTALQFTKAAQEVA
jgi:hypothetical protein